MAAVFCFTLRNKDGSYSATFHSDGEVYELKCDINNTSHSHGTLSLEWKKLSSKLITFTFYDYANNFVHKKTLFAKNDVYTSISFEPNTLCNVVVVNVTPSLGHFKNDDVKITRWDIEPTVRSKLEALSTDMEKLFHTGVFSDTILTVGSTEIRAHRGILSTRSSVFGEKLQHSVEEKGENRIIISDISTEVLRELLHFMYTGSVTIKDSNVARNLYDAADKYDVKGLKDICLTKLKSLIDVDSVLDVLVSADQQGDKVIKEVSLYLISEHYSNLQFLQVWKNFAREQQRLAFEVESYVNGSVKKTPYVTVHFDV